MKQPHSPLQNILFISLDRFIASVHEALQPELRSRPLLIVTRQRPGIVASANAKAYAHGVRSNMATDEAKQLCPDLQVLFADGEQITQFSQEFYRILHRFSEKVEAVTLDEAYVDLTGYESLWIAPEYAAIRIKETIAKEIECTASIGIASNKITAFIASKSKKPDGLTAVPWGREALFLHAQNVVLMPGVGTRIKTLLNEVGIFTIGDIAHTGPEYLRAVLGDSAYAIIKFAHGIDHRPIHHRIYSQSITRTQALKKAPHYSSVPKIISALAKKTVLHLDMNKSNARTIAVRLKLSDGSTRQRQKTYSSQLYAKDVAASARRLLLDMHYYEEPLVSVSVQLSRLSSHNHRGQHISQNSFYRLKSIKKSLGFLSRRFGIETSAYKLPTTAQLSI